MRPTTSYRVAVTGPRDHLHHLADLMVRNAEDDRIVIDQSGVVMARNEAFVRVRLATDDAMALAVAREIVPSGEFIVTTGYGVHERVITS